MPIPTNTVIRRKFNGQLYKILGYGLMQPNAYFVKEIGKGRNPSKWLRHKQLHENVVKLDYEIVNPTIRILYG